MIRRPPRSTLFPSTTLSDLRARWSWTESRSSGATRSSCLWKSSSPEKLSITPSRKRSEEHTSELQSRQYLVCRLLLETKKHTDDTLGDAQQRATQPDHRKAI